MFSAHIINLHVTIYSLNLSLCVLSTVSHLPELGSKRSEFGLIWERNDRGLGTESARVGNRVRNHWRTKRPVVAHKAL
jgi:hypothetical protein